MPYKDRETYNANKRRWYAEHGQATHRATVARRKAAIRTLARVILKILKDVPCDDCHGRFPHYVMDFDHVRGEKLFTIAEFGRLGYGIDELFDEIAKCDVVCANCHRVRTFERAKVVESRLRYDQELAR